ncbi:hypothetical protein CYLTODRAFT_494039 [Cylindrobasidium torrendii FP15055 ss-10]|uniref:Uncharacterized protein n=1 Tax=Cylindrobasidium torrendii FP15055 ss-10 TaxID=1314674 RepID=A0A0D7AZ96_9AGAR|nr:hypothetical protein CYLTODRAFT_494039 [Cylindrobasidium torrendii FP15055 ss-10]
MMNTPGDDDPRTSTAPVLVATTLLTVVLGAVLWRNNAHHNSLEPQCKVSEPSAIMPVEDADHKDKAARSKDRRRRGKDPLKDVLKGNKRGKATLAKLSKVPGLHEPSTTTPSDYVRPESSASTSRSVSAASSSRHADDGAHFIRRPNSSLAHTSRSNSVASSRDDGHEERTPTAGMPDDTTTDAFAHPTAGPSTSSSVSTSSRDSVHSDDDFFEQAARASTPETEIHIPSSVTSPQSAEDATPQPIAGPSKRKGAGRNKAAPAPSQSSDSRPGTPAQTQMASFRGALEAARLREETYRRDIERYGKELETMRWEREVWRQREAELRGQLQHLQAYMNAIFSAPSPTVPMYGFPAPSPNFYPSPVMPMFQNPNSASPSPGGSPSTRGRRRTRVEEETGVSEALADAILKRPGTLNLGRQDDDRTSSPSPVTSTTADSSSAPPSPSPLQPEEVPELTFPSLYPHPPPSSRPASVRPSS